MRNQGLAIYLFHVVSPSNITNSHGCYEKAKSLLSTMLYQQQNPELKDILLTTTATTIRIANLIRKNQARPHSYVNILRAVRGQLIILWRTVRKRHQKKNIHWPSHLPRINTSEDLLNLLGDRLEIWKNPRKIRYQTAKQPVDSKKLNSARLLHHSPSLLWVVWNVWMLKAVPTTTVMILWYGKHLRSEPCKMKSANWRK